MTVLGTQQGLKLQVGGITLHLKELGGWGAEGVASRDLPEREAGRKGMRGVC